MITFRRATLRITQEESTDVDSQLALLSQKEVEDSTYLSDLMMLAEGDLFASRGDLKAVAGLLNYGQAITHRLMTTKGRHPRDRSMGISWDKYLGKTYYSQELVIAELSSEIQEEVLRDYRTLAVSFVEAEFLDMNTLKIDIGIIPIDSNEEVIIALEAQEG